MNDICVAVAESFELRKGLRNKAELNRIDSEIKSRVEGCNKPQCWLIKDEKDIGQIYLRRKTTVDGKGRYVYMRRYLFCSVIGYIPERRKIMMLCDRDKPSEERGRCVNPSHMTYKGFVRSYGLVNELIDRGYITRYDAGELYAGGR